MKDYKELTQAELDEMFQAAIKYGDKICDEFELTFKENYGEKPYLVQMDLERIRPYKKLVEGKFIDYIETKIGVRAFQQDAQKYKFPITQDNFEFNVLNILAKLRLAMHNKVNSKAKQNG
jgi:hypothetical protein